MVEVKLTEDCMRLISQFESLTGAGSRDCVIDERNARLIFVKILVIWAWPSVKKVPQSKKPRK